MSDAKDTALGSAVALLRYPVKSMMGEEVNAADVTNSGLLGDRAYALVDAADGKLVSAKNPRKWPRLFEFRAALVEPPRVGENVPPVRITLPDGVIITSDQSDVNQVLSKTLGREVRFESTAPESPSLEEYWPDIEGLEHRDAVTDESIVPNAFFDGATVHLVTTATIDQLRKAYAAGRVEARRFRPNIVVQPPAGEEGFVENAWVDRELAIGEQVRLKITGLCPRCVMTTLEQGDLPRDPGISAPPSNRTQGMLGSMPRWCAEA